MFARHSGLMFSLKRNRHRAEPTPLAPAGLDPRVIRISVSAGLAEDLPTLGDVLGEGFAVVVDDLDGCTVAAVGPVGAVGVGLLRMAHPRPALLVVDHALIDPRRAAACLDAGAAGYISRRSVTEVAACIRSLARRTLTHSDVAPLAS
jgi:hypothetical protein